MDPHGLASRARQHAALGDPVRLAIAAELARSDRAPVELRERFGLESSLLAHHLDVLEQAGLVGRSRSSGDGRRRYVHLLAAAFPFVQTTPVRPRRALFVCTHNSARSQLAAALWTEHVHRAASSAGTHPAPEVHPGAVAAARRAGLDLGGARPRLLPARIGVGTLVVTVCDRAHEELGDRADWLHWSIPDPSADKSAAAFDRAVAELTDRIARVAIDGRAA